MPDLNQMIVRLQGVATIPMTPNLMLRSAPVSPGAHFLNEYLFCMNLRA